MSARRVLLVDDEEMVRLSLRDMLELAGYEVVGEAMDGEEAVRLAKAVRPDVILMDINMPRMDGIQAAKEIMASTPLPVVFLTAYSDSRNVSRASEAGAFAYLVKPCRQADLVPAIETALARFQEAQAQQQDAEHVRWALETVRRLSREITTNPDIDGVVGLALRCVLSAMKVPAAALLLARRDHLVIRAHLGVESVGASAFRVPLGETLFGKAIVTGQPAAFTGGDEESHRGTRALPPPFAWAGSAVAAPLHDAEARERGEALGCLAVFRPEPAAFSSAQISILQALADELVIAFQMAQTRQALAWRLWRNTDPGA